MTGSLSSAPAFAQGSEPMSCYWQFEEQNEVAISENLFCNNPVSSDYTDLLIAKKVSISGQGYCGVSWMDGYRTELKGSITVTGEKSACYGHSILYQAAPATRTVDGAKETLLDCGWKPKGNNTHQLICNTSNGQTLNLPIASKLQQNHFNSCNMIFDANMLKSFDSGTVSVDKIPKPDDCDVGPVYFRAYPKKRIVNGFEQTLLQCEWRSQNNQLSMKYCTGAEGWNNDVVVAYKLNSSTYSLVDGLNKELKNGLLIEDKSLNSVNPPLYFRSY